MKVTLVVASQINKGTFFRGFFLSKYLAQRGHDVTLVCSGESATSYTRQAVEGFTLITLPYSNRFLTWLPIQVVSGAMSCVQQLVNSSDVVHVFQLAMPSSWFPALFARLTSLAQRRRLFFDWDDLWGDNGILVDQGRAASIVASFLEEGFLSLADGVSVTSEFLSKRAIVAGARKVFYLPNGTEMDSAPKQPKVAARKILGITDLGVILCHVGFADFTNVWNRIKSAYPTVTLIVIGQPPRYNMRRITKTNDPQVIYTGHIDSSKVKAYLSASDILLLKTNNESSEQARFPIRLGDYLSAERPIVAGDIGEIGRVMRQSGCGFLSRPGDDPDFANRIIELIGTPKIWDEMGVKAQQMAERLSWIHLAGELEEMYKSAE